MARTKKLHPADARNAAIVARAVRFEVAHFLGVGRYAHHSAATFADAKREAARIAAEHPNGRVPMIYAFDASGRAATVADDSAIPEQENEMKFYSKKSNATRAARTQMRLRGGKAEAVKTASGWTWQWQPGAKPADAGAHLAADPSRLPQPAAESAGPDEPAVPITELDPAKHPLAKANDESWDAIPAVRAARKRGKRAEIEAAAREGTLPAPPDFSAATHTRFRAKLAKIVALVAAGDIDGLKAFPINPVSSSPKAMARYRDLCVVALEAR